VSGRLAAQRSARPARLRAPPGLRPELLRPKAARYARARLLREASLAFPRREAARPWARLPELERVSPLVSRAGAPRLPAGCLFGARPLEASARLATPAQRARSSPPEVSVMACVRAVLRSAAQVAEQPQAVPARDVAVAQQQEVATAVSAAAAEPQQVAGAAVSDAVAEPQQAAGAAVSDAAAEPQQAVEAAGPGVAAGPQQGAAVAVPDVAAGLRPEAAGVAVLAAAAQPPAGEPVAWVLPQAVARPSAAPWVFRPGRFLLWPAPRRAVRFAHAIRSSRTASPSERSWQAARCEDLS
jgi:hypothetical protein